MERKYYFKTAAVLTALFLSAALVPVRAEASEGGAAQSTAAPEDITEYIIPITAEGEVVSDVFVRRGPSRDYEVIGTVREKDRVQIDGRTYDGWYRIEFEEQAGFVYGDYLTVTEREEPNDPVSEEEPSEPEPEEEPDEPEDKGADPEEMAEQPDLDGIDWGYLKLAAVVVIVAMIVAIIILIMWSLLQASRSEKAGGEQKSRKVKREGRKPEDGKKADKKSADRTDTQPDAVEDGGGQEQDLSTPEKAKTIIIREEDYQLHIDPKYFEDEPLAQPDYVTDYLKKMEQENTKPVAKKEHTDDLTKAMKKLEELQEEIERLKKK